MNTTENEEGLGQLNTRVPIKIKKDVKRIAKRAKISLEVLTADALSFYFGKTDDLLLKARRTIVMETMRTMKERLE
jgi:hypothetical protein